jgi:hypothetical protein
MKKLFGFVVVVVALSLTGLPALAQTGKGGVKSKFYDFSDQLIDGEIKKPTTLYTDARQKVQFDRLAKLKKSFLEPMLQSAKEDVFK